MDIVEIFFGFRDYNSVVSPPLAFSFNEDNTQDGLQIIAHDVSPIIPGAAPIPTYRIQMSMVAVGIREHNPLTYPDQIIFPDEFKYNSIEPISNIIGGPAQIAGGSNSINFIVSDPQISATIYN